MADEKQSREELLALVEPLEQYEGCKIQHRKSGDWYVIVGVHFRESDMSIGFTYETLHASPLRFERPIAELLDGRWRFA